MVGIVSFSILCSRTSIKAIVRSALDFFPFGATFLAHCSREPFHFFFTVSLVSCVINSAFAWCNCCSHTL